MNAVPCARDAAAGVAGAEVPGRAQAEQPADLALSPFSVKEWAREQEAAVTLTSGIPGSGPEGRARPVEEQTQPVRRRTTASRP